MTLTAKILPNGDLLTTADNETRNEIAEFMSSGRNRWTILADIFEPYSCNGSFTPFDASDGNPFVGLTSAPCVAECLNYEDSGDRTIDGRFWYSPDYCLINELEQLKNRGRFVWSLAQ